MQSHPTPKLGHSFIRSGNFLFLFSFYITNFIYFIPWFCSKDWDKESKEGYKQSNLEDQCTHRYKIYIEGWAWSVSEKYIMSCDSMTLYVKPRFFDFFIRGMLPLQHFWPINDRSKCSSLKFAVEWGNNHTNQVFERRILIYGLNGNEVYQNLIAGTSNRRGGKQVLAREC